MFNEKVTRKTLLWVTLPFGCCEENGSEGCGVAAVVFFPLFSHGGWNGAGGLRGGGEGRAGFSTGPGAPEALGSPHPQGTTLMEQVRGIWPLRPSHLLPEALKLRPSSVSATQRSAQQELEATFLSPLTATPAPSQPCLCPPPSLPAPEMLPSAFLLPAALFSILNRLLPLKPLLENYRLQFG